MINENLISAFHYHRREIWPRGNAAKALELARRDAALNVRRYVSGGIGKLPYSAVVWQPFDSDLPASLRYRERLAYVEDPERAGLRYVGRVVADCGRRNGFWDKSERSGWFTDPHGETFKDGTGLAWGVVYQLPARDGRARFIAGYQFGGTDAGPTLDLSNVFESCSADNCSYERSQGHEDAIDAARAADSMAQAAAEHEREYQTAYAAGSEYADCRAELAENRKSVLQTIREIKGACDLVRQLPDALKNAIRSVVDQALQDRTRIFDKMTALAAGDCNSLSFYSGEERLQAAFCEAAGLSKFPR